MLWIQINIDNILYEPIVKLRLSSFWQPSPFNDIRYDIAESISGNRLINNKAFVMAQKLTFIEKFDLILNWSICRLIPYPICYDQLNISIIQDE